MLRALAQSAPFLAPLPSAWFIGRSIYLHLLHDWPLPVPPAVNLTVATIAGISIEVLAIVSVHNGLALFRWNDQGRVQKQGWERAPFWLAVACMILYLLTAGILLVLLEAVPQAAQYAPILFPLLGLVGAVNLGILDQHRSRLLRYGLTWDLTTMERKRTTTERRPNDSRTIAERRPNDSRTIAEQPNDDQAFACPECNEPYASRYHLAGHMNKHRGGENVTR